LDNTGFLVIPNAAPNDSELRDILLNGSEDQIKDIYYPQVEELIKKHTGASSVIFFDNTVRRPRDRPGTDPKSRQAVQRTHIDQTVGAAYRRVERHAKDLKWKRFQIMNVWKPISNVVKDYPLALCDFRSIDVHHDIVPTTVRHFGNPLGEMYTVKYSDKQRWYYYSDMTPQDVLLFKCYDSYSKALSKVTVGGWEGMNKELVRGVAGLVPHTAFYDAEAAKSGMKRDSIEVRALVFYDDDSDSADDIQKIVQA
jgi:cephamycin C biosynthesis protein